MARPAPSPAAAPHRRAPCVATRALLRCAALWLAAALGCATGVVDDPLDGGRRRDARGDGAHDGADVPLRSECEDRDGDGFGVGITCRGPDCDDGNFNIYPGATEACNGLDDDCDGEVDDGFGTFTCGVGACARTVPNCMDGRHTRCVPGDASAETCNGVDDDCDGETDEDVAARTCGVGACQRSVAGCGGGACTPGDAPPETCNGADDDCDGETDEGSRAAAVHTGYSTLVGLHGGCDGAGQRIGPDCNAAMHRFCARRGCTNSGFGPVENSGDVAVVTCVIGEAPHSVPFATLLMHHEACNGGTERIGPSCNAAIHRYCRSRGFASGFGPVESGSDAVSVTCVPAAMAVVVDTTYSALATFHGPCNGTTQRAGPDCNAAIHRFCARRGHASGFGPVENAGNVAVVVCVSP